MQNTTFGKKITYFKSEIRFKLSRFYKITKVKNYQFYILLDPFPKIFVYFEKKRGKRLKTRLKFNQILNFFQFCRMILCFDLTLTIHNN